MAATAYSAYLDEILRPRPDPRKGTVLDLFCGAGGLALGFEAAGFHTVGHDSSRTAVATYNRNLAGVASETSITPDTDYTIRPRVIVAGPPCQPFSRVGLEKGAEDGRNGFPSVIAAIRKLRPEIAVIENVKGLVQTGREYLKAVTAELESIGGYQVDVHVVGAADFGVPQKRDRVLIACHRGGFTLPAPVTRRVTVGDALGDLARSAPEGSRFLTPSMDEYVARYEKASKCARPRDLRLDAPARTLTCRNLAAATSDMIRLRLPDGRRRMLTVEEARLLQSFPSWFEFEGSADEAFRQIGNSVPPLLALGVARSVAACLGESLTDRKAA